MTNIYLIRHCEAEGNVFRRCHGWYDADITARGARQSELVAERLCGEPIEKIYSSDLYRARRTAMPLARMKGLGIIPVQGLREINLGFWEDKMWGELPLEYPEQFGYWEREPFRCVPEGGESVRRVGERMYATIARLAEENEGKTIACFSHGAAARSFLCLALAKPLEEIKTLGWCENTAVSRLTYDGERFRVVYYYSDEHLKQAEGTLANQNWWRAGDDLRRHNLRMRAAVLPEDLDLVEHYAHLFFKSAYGSDEILDHEGYARLVDRLALDEDGASFAMSVDEPVGMILVDFENTDYESCAFIRTLAVDEQYRGAGFAPQLLGHAVSRARSRGLRNLRANVAKTNGRALAFYQKYHFAPAGEDEKHIVMMRSVKVDSMLRP